MGIPAILYIILIYGLPGLLLWGIMGKMLPSKNRNTARWGIALTLLLFVSFIVIGYFVLTRMGLEITGITGFIIGGGGLILTVWGVVSNIIYHRRKRDSQ